MFEKSRRFNNTSGNILIIYVLFVGLFTLIYRYPSLFLPSCRWCGALNVHRLDLAAVCVREVTLNK